ncbi:MAG: BNR-4 repeat-containing protein [Candidatus Hydrogenedentes bacterium]|nr:BNR-4 repeat-containing protein [Candidatus Hydrogenedentota bacterium]
MCLIKSLGFIAVIQLSAACQDLLSCILVDNVWSGHPVGFALLTDAPRQYVGYYDAERRMVIAQRSLDSMEWARQVLDETLEWDSHNYIEMALDATGNLHVSGNMHGHPLKYFRTLVPYDVTTLERVPAMVGKDEAKVTYPFFMKGPQGELIFKYRDGSSGSGNEIYNGYDAASQQWRRLMDTPLVDGEGQRNAYFDGPVLGPDGYYHLAWVWRETRDCETNHDVTYARSRDLQHWENSHGTVYTLPITLATAEIVDPVPVGGGLINGNVRLGFDAEKQVVISYHKYDAQGNSQVSNARLENGAWLISQITHWEFRWNFQGPGAIPFEVHVDPIQIMDDGSTTQEWSTKENGRERWRLDPQTLALIERMDLPSKRPSGEAVRSSFPGMQVRSEKDTGAYVVDGKKYVLRWESLGPNRDRAREKPWPEASGLEVCLVANGDPH